jgi:hypothetical protein
MRILSIFATDVLTPSRVAHVKLDLMRGRYIYAESAFIQTLETNMVLINTNHFRA